MAEIEDVVNVRGFSSWKDFFETFFIILEKLLTKGRARSRRSDEGLGGEGGSYREPGPNSFIEFIQTYKYLSWTESNIKLIEVAMRFLCLGSKGVKGTVSIDGIPPRGGYCIASKS